MMIKINPTDLQEAHHHLTKAILFLDRNGVEDQVEVLLKVKTALPKPSKKKRSQGKGQQVA